jgi:XTP/dITP diphosphohydrolase
VKLLLATSNAGKVREISRILSGLPLEIVSLREFEEIVPARESGKSFVANARIKARTYYRQTRLLTLAEDSGLQVDILGGQPGCLSARFAGNGASDSANVMKLLEEAHRSFRVRVGNNRREKNLAFHRKMRGQNRIARTGAIRVRI